MTTTIEERTTLIDFPCPFPLKIMGVHHPEFGSHILTAIQEHAPATSEKDVVLKASTKGNYVSATITVLAHSQTQLDTIYQMLCAHPMVKIVF